MVKILNKWAFVKQRLIMKVIVIKWTIQSKNRKNLSNIRKKKNYVDLVIIDVYLKKMHIFVYF